MWSGCPTSSTYATTSARCTQALYSPPARPPPEQLSSAHSWTSWGRSRPWPSRPQIAYKKLAKGEITATGRFTEDSGALKAKLSEDGRIRFPVEVEMTNAEGVVVAEMTVNWYVRRNDA